MIQAGIPPVEVMKITGHTQWSTFDRYVNQDEDSARRIAEKRDRWAKEEELNREANREADEKFIN